MARKSHPTDLTDQQWSILASGCAWRLLPHDFPPWSTVYYYLRWWRIDRVWQQLNQALRQKVRRQRGRSTPSAAIVNSQSVKTTEVAQQACCDGAELVKGHKRHILVDTLGLLLQVVVGAANISEKAGAKLLLEKIEPNFPRLIKIFADEGYKGKDFIASVEENYQLD